MNPSSFTMTTRLFPLCPGGPTVKSARGLPPRSTRFRSRLGILLAGIVALGAHAQEASPPTQMPTVLVEGEQPPLEEESLVGPYSQPEWTLQRRFSTTRVYLQQGPGEAGFEQWWRGRFFRDGTAQHLLQEEAEVGLPYRTQLDLYEDWTVDDHQRARHHDVAAELRWALADWGKIPLNPTLYGEWNFVDKTQGPDVFELRLLLGEDLAPRWHWGLNTGWEQQTGANRATELAWSQGLSYTVVDQRLDAGVEMVFRHETDALTRSQPAISFLLGPSIQVRPWKSSHVDLVPLFGVTGASPRAEIYLIFGFDFWPGESGRPSHYAPVPLRGQ